MRTLLTVANRRPVDLISPLLVQEEQITSTGSIGHKSAELARFSRAVHAFSALSTFFTRYPHFWPFAVRAAPLRVRERGVDAVREKRGLFAHLYTYGSKN